MSRIRMSTPSPAEFTKHWLQSRHMVAAYVRSQVINEHDADDITQKVAIDAATNFERYDIERPFAYWVIGIAKRQIALHFREHRRDRHTFDQTLLDQMTDVYVDVADELAEQTVALKHCLGKLNQRGQDIIEMRYQQSLKPNEIASRIGTTSTSIRSLLYRLRNQLEDCIKKQLSAMGGK